MHSRRLRINQFCIWLKEKEEETSEREKKTVLEIEGSTVIRRELYTRI